jgi:hypothetical protein
MYPKRLVGLLGLIGLVGIVLGFAGSVTHAQNTSAAADWSPVKMPGPDAHPRELVAITDEVRAFVRDRSSRGVPDYAAVAEKKKKDLPALRQKLVSLNTSAWSVHDRSWMIWTSRSESGARPRATRAST